MRSNTVLFLQSMLASAQVVNAGLATVHANAVLALAIGAVVAGLQFYVQNVGNKIVPPPTPAQPPVAPK